MPTKETIIQELIDKYNISKEFADILKTKSKEDLVKYYDEVKNKIEVKNDVVDEVGESIQVEDFEKVVDTCEVLDMDEKPVDTPKPTMADPEWHDYVMSHFKDDELIEGNPTVDGLRRVTNLILGPIVESSTSIVQAPNRENGMCAVAECGVLVYPKTGNSLLVREAADSFPGNTDSEYIMFPTAIASTRAEGRALRKLLKLKRVVAAEEATSKPIEEAGVDGFITPQQINVIDLMCRRTNIHVFNFINSGQNKYTSISQVPYDKAGAMVQQLNVYQQDSSKISPSIKGYQEWRK